MTAQPQPSEDSMTKPKPKPPAQDIDEPIPYELVDHDFDLEEATKAQPDYEADETPEEGQA